MKSRSFSISNVVACFVSMLIFVLSMSFSFDVNAASTSRMYRRYNAVTNAYLGSYTLQALSTTNNSVSPYTVIGSDDRVVDFTKSGVVKIIGSSGFGSGFVVDAHTIATAAHCVYNKSIQSIKLFDSNGNVSKTVIPVETHVPQSYILPQANSRDTKYDYALITVNEDLSDYVIFDLGVALDTAISNGIAVSVTGFPGQIDNSFNENSMCTGTGILKSPIKNDNGDYKLYYTADTSNGNSGGPVYFTKNYFGRVYYTVIAIHTSGFDPNDSDMDHFNCGTRITPDLLHFYMSNPNI